MKTFLSLLGAYTAQYARTKLEYRADVFTTLLTDLAQQVVLLLLVLVVFGHVPDLRGWTRAELLFIYGYFLIPWSLMMALSGRLWDFGEQYVVRGEMDRLLTRPVPSLFQVLLEGIQLESLGGLVTGTVLMAVFGRAAGVVWHWWDGPLLLVGIIGSLLVYLGVYVSVNTIAFFTDSKHQLEAMVFNINSNYGRYPVDWYNQPLQFLLRWLLPFAFVGVYPSAYFLRRGDWLFWALLTPVMGVACLTVALLLWRAGVRRYHGAGS